MVSRGRLEWVRSRPMPARKALASSRGGRVSVPWDCLARDLCRHLDLPGQTRNSTVLVPNSGYEGKADPGAEVAGFGLEATAFRWLLAVNARPGMKAKANGNSGSPSRWLVVTVARLDRHFKIPWPRGSSDRSWGRPFVSGCLFGFRFRDRTCTIGACPPQHAGLSDGLGVDLLTN